MSPGYAGVPGNTMVYIDRGITCAARAGYEACRAWDEMKDSTSPRCSWDALRDSEQHDFETIVRLVVAGNTVTQSTLFADDQDRLDVFLGTVHVFLTVWEDDEDNGVDESAPDIVFPDDIIIAAAKSGYTACRAWAMAVSGFADVPWELIDLDRRLEFVRATRELSGGGSIAEFSDSLFCGDRKVRGVFLYTVDTFLTIYEEQIGEPGATNDTEAPPSPAPPASPPRDFSPATKQLFKSLGKGLLDGLMDFASKQVFLEAVSQRANAPATADETTLKSRLYEPTAPNAPPSVTVEMPPCGSTLHSALADSSGKCPACAFRGTP